MLGRAISYKCKQLLVWCGIDPGQIQQWSFESIRQRDVLDVITTKEQRRIEFPKHDLPDGELIDANNPNHQNYVEYLRNRGMELGSYPFMVTPREVGRNSQRIIIPFTHNEVIVGHTSRYLDNKIPKFINKMPPGYLFGMDLQHRDWSVAIVVEGIFDALSIDGLATMHDDISDEQVALLSTLNRKIIYVPDRDKQGLGVIDRALELGYNVSIPQWHDSIKDVNDAVVRYGKLQTLMSILQYSTNSAIKIDRFRRDLVKRL